MFCGLYYKCFIIVIYNYNVSVQYYKTTIIIKASLSYDRNLRSKLKRKLRS